MILDSDGLKFSVRAEWESFVLPEDRSFVADLIGKLEHHPGIADADLFHTLCQLNLGPVITDSVASLNADGESGFVSDALTRPPGRAPQ